MRDGLSFLVEEPGVDPVVDLCSTRCSLADKTLAASDGAIPNKTPPSLQPAFPADYAKGVVYTTLDRSENK
jgi:hypothetical protein